VPKRAQNNSINKRVFLALREALSVRDLIYSDLNGKGQSRIKNNSLALGYCGYWITFSFGR
jgi:hypothetical protein